MKPLFSIVTVTLNCAGQIELTVASLQTQTFTNYEYIVKDGGSSDGTIDRLHTLGVEQIHISKDSGIYDAMNQAVRLCQGDFICFMNAGDTFPTPQVLEQAAEIIQNHPRQSFFCGDLLTLEEHPLFGRGPDGTGRIIRFPENYTRRDLFTESVCQQTWLVRRDLYVEHPLDTTLSLNADHEFFIYWLTRDPNCYLHLPLITASYAGGGASEIRHRELRVQRRTLMSRYFRLNERILFRLWLLLRQIFRIIKFTLTPEGAGGK